MIRDDYEYYLRRVGLEERAVANATCTVARDRHQELADAYRLRCSLILELNKFGSAPTVIAHPTNTRQPIVSSNSTALAASPAAAARPLCRA